MKKSTGVILFFVCIAVILAAGCTTTALAPVKATEKIVYITVLVTPTPKPPAIIQNSNIVPNPTPTSPPTSRPTVTTDPSKYVQSSSARTDNDSGTPDDFPPIISGKTTPVINSNETTFIECIHNQESKNIQQCMSLLHN